MRYMSKRRNLLYSRNDFLCFFLLISNRYDELITFFIVYFFLFQIAKAKAESRIECLRNGDGNGTYITFYCLEGFNRGIIDFYIFLIKMNLRLNIKAC